MLFSVVFKPLSLSWQEKNLKAEEEQRRQQKERAEIEKLRQAEERKRYMHHIYFLIRQVKYDNFRRGVDWHKILLTCYLYKERRSWKYKKSSSLKLIKRAFLIGNGWETWRHFKSSTKKLQASLSTFGMTFYMIWPPILCATCTLFTVIPLRELFHASQFRVIYFSYPKQGLELFKVKCYCTPNRLQNKHSASWKWWSLKVFP